MSPFTTQTVRATPNAPLVHNAAATPRANDDAKDHGLSLCGTIHCLAQRKAVGVVLNMHLASQSAAEVLRHGFAIEDQRVGASHALAPRIQ